MAIRVNGSDGVTYTKTTSSVTETNTNKKEINFYSKGVPGEITPSGTDLRMISGHFAGVPDFKHGGYIRITNNDIAFDPSHISKNVAEESYDATENAFA